MWNTDETFGFDRESAGGNLATAATPASPASAPLVPHVNPLKALTDPHGSAIFWIAAAAVLGLAMVSGQLSVAAKLNARGGRK